MGTVKNIHKYIITLCIFASIIHSSQAQSKITYGFGAGFTYSTVHYEGYYFDFKDASGRPGLQGSFFFNLPVYKSLSLQPEIGYISLRSSQLLPLSGSADEPRGTAEDFTTLNYLTLTVLPKFTFSTTRLSVLAGPSLGYKVHSHDSYYFHTIFYDPGIPEQTDYKPWSFSGVVGLEYIPSEGIGFSARYLYGFSNITTNGWAGIKTSSRSFLFSLNYRFK